MYTLLRYEWKTSRKSFLIWTLAVGGLGLICILLYQSMGDSVKEMADSFSDMGSFSDAFGMSTLSIATLTGYFATEIGAVHGLGGSMFAASIATNMLSKEEDSHTAEFTFTLPVSRRKIVVEKWITILGNILLFHLICGILYAFGFIFLKEEIPYKKYFLFMGLQLLMCIEIAAVCFLVSACSKRNRPGIGIGIALLSYMLDICGRVVPDMKEIMMITPFSYANASQIFAGTSDSKMAILIGISITIVCLLASEIIYVSRDLAS